MQYPVRIQNNNTHMLCATIICSEHSQLKIMHNAYNKFKFSEMSRWYTFLNVLFNDVVNWYDHIAQVTDQWMRKDCRWNDTDMIEQKYWYETLSQCHYVHNKSNMYLPWAWTRASTVTAQLLTALTPPVY